MLICLNNMKYSNNIRLRFAPSPTGFLHIGSLRTALFNYVIAKKLGGKLILRIEDTDQKREVEGATEKLINILDWIGIKFDEGSHIGGDFGPYTQSQRQDVYKKYSDKLLKNNKAYYCFCTSERLQKMREDQQAKKLAPRYDKKCRNLNEKEINQKIKSGAKFVIRQKMPLDGEIKVFDELRGEIKFQAKDLEDHVLIKSNNIPTYQFASVVDDHLMEVSHVVRGDEWIASFPKNVLLYQAFGWEIPKFIHTPLILNKEGGKLSKRQGDVTVENYKDQGYLPEALINFSALLGWHPKDEKEILSLNETIEKFNIKDIRASSAVFDPEKLDYLNGYYIRKMPLNKLTELCSPYLIKQTTESRQQTTEFIKKVISLEQERMKKLSEIGELTEFFFVDKLQYEPELLIWKRMSLEEVKNNLGKIYTLLEKIPKQSWTNNSIQEAIMTYLQAKELKTGEYLWPMRVALTGRKASPGPFDVAEVLGKEKSLERIDLSRNKLCNVPPQL